MNAEGIRRSADICMNRSEFEEMFEHRHYRAMRRKFNAENAFPEIFDKVIPEKWIREKIDGLCDETS